MNRSMKTKIVITIIIVFAIVAALSELFYFRFHTYLQKTEVNEDLPAAVNPAPINGVPPSAPTMRVLAEGQFGEIDLIHKGSGVAKIIEQDGKRYLRFENFEVTNGPDLYVYLSNSTAPSQDEKSLGQYANLGRLKGNIGNQNYEIPESYYDYNTVIIWCKEFGVLFSYAIMR